jgi:hypothetical protein
MKGIIYFNIDFQDIQKQKDWLKQKLIQHYQKMSLNINKNYV